MERLIREDGEQVLQAVREHDVERLRGLLAAGLSPDSSSEMGETPLGLGVCADDAEIVGLLLASGASPARWHADMGLPLDIAVVHGCTRALKALLEAGVCADDGRLGCALLAAAKHGQSGAVWLLLAYRAQPNVAGPDGLTPLHYAAMRDAHETATLLLQNGASPDARSIGGATPLHVAAMANSVRVLALLVEAGADPNGLAVALDERVAQECVSLGGSTTCSQPLTAGCATAMAANSARWRGYGLGFSPLHYAAAGGAVDAIGYLCTAGAETEAGIIPSPQAVGQTAPAHRAEPCFAGGCERASQAAATLPTGQGQGGHSYCSLADCLEQHHGVMLPTPLHVAVAAGQLPAVAALVAHGADINARSHRSLGTRMPWHDCGCPVSSPLQWAVEFGQYQIAWFLLERGASANSLGCDEWGAAPARPLYAAVMAGDYDMALLLMQHGANPNHWRDPSPGAADEPCETLSPLHWAAASGDLHFARTLLAHGADTNAGASGGSGPTPLDCAIAEGHEEMAELLRERGAATAAGH